jgi:bifunctional DNA-binding transcriptional regulator/antitoxin component of YhaV-PrlF toxin-antitoxin module
LYRVKTTLNADGKIAIPDEIRRSDHLAAGDCFELERVTGGHYMLTKQMTLARFTIGCAEDGLPVIRADSGVITSQTVKDIESQFQ